MQTTTQQITKTETLIKNTLTRISEKERELEALTLQRTQLIMFINSEKEKLEKARKEYATLTRKRQQSLL